MDAKLLTGRNRNKHLRTVRNDTLEHTGEGIQQRGCFSSGNAVVSGHFGSNRICHNNSHGIVRRCDVHNSYQEPHPQLSALFSTESPVDPAEKCIEATVFPNQRTDCRNKDSYHRGFKHSGSPGAHTAQKCCRSNGSCCQHDQRTGQDANQQDNKHIDARDSSD